MQSAQNEGMVKYVSTVVMRVILVVTGIVQLMGEDVRKVEKYGHFACCCKGGRKMWVQTFKTQQAEGKAAFNTSSRSQTKPSWDWTKSQFVQDDMMHISEDDSFVFTIQEQTCTLSTAANLLLL